MSNVYFIIFEHGWQFESELIVKSSWVLSIDTTLLVWHLFPLSPPPPIHPQYSLILRHRIDNWRHTVVEQRIVFSKIYHIESILFVDHHPLHREVEPLIISCWVHVIAHHQVILVFLYFKCCEQISTLKMWVKYETISLRNRKGSFGLIVVESGNLRNLVRVT